MGSYTREFSHPKEVETQLAVTIASLSQKAVEKVYSVKANYKSIK